MENNMNNPDILLNIIKFLDSENALKIISIIDPSTLAIVETILKLKESESCKYCNAIDICVEILGGSIADVCEELICPIHGELICSWCSKIVNALEVDNDDSNGFVCCDDCYTKLH